jgi:hypothetical protein
MSFSFRQIHVYAIAKNVRATLSRSEMARSVRYSSHDTAEMAYWSDAFLNRNETCVLTTSRHSGPNNFDYRKTDARISRLP